MSLMGPEIAAKQNKARMQKPSEMGIKSYATKEGLIMLGVFAPHQYVTLYTVLRDLGFELKALETVACWQDVWDLTENNKASLANIIITKTADDWVDILHAAGLAAERVQTLEESINSDQLRARNYFASSPLDSNTKLPLAPYKMSEGGPALTSLRQKLENIVWMFY